MAVSFCSLSLSLATRLIVLVSVRALTRFSSSSSSSFFQTTNYLSTHSLSITFLPKPTDLIIPSSVLHLLFSSDRLDPALIRPGRFDIKVGFSLATRAQAIGLFLRMMLPTKGEIEREIARRAAVASILETRTSTKSEEEAAAAVELDLGGEEKGASGEGGEQVEFAGGEWHEEKTHRVKRLAEEFGRAVPEGVL